MPFLCAMTAFLLASTAHSQDAFRLEIDQARQLVIPAFSTPGALLIYRSSDVAFTNGLDMQFGCNTPHTKATVPLNLTNRQSFYFGVHWPGHHVTEVFGPEIQGCVWEPLGNRTYEVTLIAHFGSVHPIKPDRYKIEVLRANRTLMPDVEWTGTDSHGLTGYFSNQLQTASFTFRIPDNESPSNMIVRASSSLVPDIFQEVDQGVVHLNGTWALAPALVDIPSGTFIMGSPPNEALRRPWEGPQTTVKITHSFKMGPFEVTQAQYKAIMSNNPSYFAGVTNRPVEQVTWADAVEYCQRLTERMRQSGALPSGWSYRLPTEAEWEYACRAGTTNAFSTGSTMSSNMANFDWRFEYDQVTGIRTNATAVKNDRMPPVGSFMANQWGLYDMHGGVWEWCLDGWSYFLQGGSISDPIELPLGADRVVRGGCWCSAGNNCRSATRLPCDMDYFGNEVGFRVVLAREE
jgi:formylglycine-generating enzyme required for sulfatase activity